jgi:hypothetical protein
MTGNTFSRTTAGGAAISICEETGILEMICVTELLLCLLCFRTQEVSHVPC